MISYAAADTIAKSLPTPTTPFRDALLKAASEAHQAGHRVYGELWGPMEATLGWKEFIQAGLTEALHEKTIVHCRTAAEYVDGCQSVRRVCIEVGEANGISQKTAWKWMCERNPLYEAGASTEEGRYDRLVAAVRCIALFTESP